MAILWNRVTWYSKLLAVVVFGATFIIAFYLGIAHERLKHTSAVVPTPALPVAPVE